MKVTQQVSREGGDLMLRIHEHPSGKLLGQIVWKGAAKYLRPVTTRGYLTLMVPEKAGLDIKP